MSASVRLSEVCVFSPRKRRWVAKGIKLLNAFDHSDVSKSPSDDDAMSCGAVECVLCSAGGVVWCWLSQFIYKLQVVQQLLAEIQMSLL